jgi:hypothetical protein
VPSAACLRPHTLVALKASYTSSLLGAQRSTLNVHILTQKAPAGALRSTPPRKRCPVCSGSQNAVCAGTLAAQSKSCYYRRLARSNAGAVPGYSVYLLYWYQSTNTDAAHAHAELATDAPHRLLEATPFACAWLLNAGAQFTAFTGAKVQILMRGC